MKRPARHALLLLCLAAGSGATASATSVCHGTPGNGRLEAGVPLPESGANFTPYSVLGVTLGRTHAHAKVAAAVGVAYATLERTAKGTMFVYGESGWSSGGRIKPHRTHQNGLSVDFMVPVVDDDGVSVPLPTGVFNRFGYDIEFDAKARSDGLAIDFEAIAEHLHALDAAARAEGIGISRVIFDNAYMPRLLRTRRGAWIGEHVTFMKGEPWVRHDEHYHVDFDVPCRPMRD